MQSISDDDDEGLPRGRLAVSAQPAQRPSAGGRVRVAVRRQIARNRTQATLVAVVLAIVLVRLPFSLASDLRGARADARLSAAAVAEARGPAALAGTNIGLLRAAQARIPRRASFAIVRAGSWGTDAHPNRARAFVWEAGQSWTQYYLAPRVETSTGRARWLLLRDVTPGAAGVRRPLHAWRFGSDWLVEQRT
jgi:hypothetical protein